jgi:predicted  nucleic acid-binding Zn-ribbon protein
MDSFNQSQFFINESAASALSLKSMILEKNVADLQKELYDAYKRIKELNEEIAELKKKQK